MLQVGSVGAGKRVIQKKSDFELSERKTPYLDALHDEKFRIEEWLKVGPAQGGRGLQRKNLSSDKRNTWT